ncbi:calcium-binding protein [Nocardioides abyssi]|uniref:Calcium-binding protein n=1 Tax=Nocardioides abyssi TaxID=3058370 RepID=A0ABT8ET79_9ACTN|nr:calcium-binding protein [Nocardioides abyssi]MDN4161348.1 calcium-binding protein [Nocardioides abyssi]
MRTVRALLPLTLLAATLAASPTVAADAPPTCRGLEATIVGTPADDTIRATPGPDVVVGLGGDDVLLGRGGDDVLCGGEGADRLEGGLGDDALHGGQDREERTRTIDTFGDTLAGGPGDDLLDPGADLDGDGAAVPDRVTYAGSATPVRIDLPAATVTGEGADRLVVAGQPVTFEGSPHDDTVVGTDGDDLLEPGAGSDTVQAGAGMDRVRLDPDGAPDRDGDDVVVLGPTVLGGYDTVVSHGGRDRVTGTDGTDYVRALGAEPVVVDLGGGDDFADVRAARGWRLDAGEGSDALRLFGGRGEQARRVAVDARRGTVATAAGTAAYAGVEVLELWYGAGWTYRGTAARDVVDAGQATGPLDARLGGGWDRVTASSGADVLRGGAGTDRVIGGARADRCRSFEVGDCG